jgi:hypothetical protein
MTKSPNADIEQHRYLIAEPPCSIIMIPNGFREIDLAQAEGALPPGCDALDRGPSDGSIRSGLTAAMENQRIFAAHQLMLTDEGAMCLVVHPERARYYRSRKP